ncbi:hypothetical protein ACWIGW_12875 [Nocardia brasiliensis]
MFVKEFEKIGHHCRLLAVIALITITFSGFGAPMAGADIDNCDLDRNVCVKTENSRGLYIGEVRVHLKSDKSGIVCATCYYHGFYHAQVVGADYDESSIEKELFADGGYDATNYEVVFSVLRYFEEGTRMCGKGWYQRERGAESELMGEVCFEIHS